MDLQRILAIHYAPELGMRGACTTIRDLAAYRRAGLLRGEPLGYHVKLVTKARVESANHLGAGNRWRRRFNRLVAAFPQLQIPASAKNPAKQAVADLAHDTATEGYARRPFRTNPHD